MHSQKRVESRDRKVRSPRGKNRLFRSVPWGVVLLAGFGLVLGSQASGQQEGADPEALTKMLQEELARNDSVVDQYEQEILELRTENDGLYQTVMDFEQQLAKIPHNEQTTDERLRVEHNLRRVETTIGANQQTIDVFDARRTELVENNKEFTGRIEALNRSTQQAEVTIKSTDELRAAALKKVDESPQGREQHKAILQGMQFKTVLSVNVVLGSEAQEALDALAEAGEEFIEVTERSVTIDDVVIPVRREEEGRYVFSIEDAQKLIEALSKYPLKR